MAGRSVLACDGPRRAVPGAEGTDVAGPLGSSPVGCGDGRPRWRPVV